MGPLYGGGPSFTGVCPMGMSIGGTDELNSEINVTPMVDVMLVLLIIFMIVTPLLQDGVNVNIPKDVLAAVEDPDLASDKAVVVAIPDDNVFWIGTNNYALENLGDQIKSLTSDSLESERIVYVKGGVDVSYGTVVNAIDVIRKQGVTRVGLVADLRKAAGE
jgi:biopolymer transport protein TolR